MPLRIILPALSALLVSLMALTAVEHATTTPSGSETATTTESGKTTEKKKTKAEIEAEEAAAESKRLTTAGGTLLNSVVNILCTPYKSAAVQGISGTGVIIDPRGVILTVSHVAQTMLLQDYPKKGSLECVIRTGSPARDAYTAEIAYISPSWIAENPSTLSEDTPVGTGENDFALLAITGSARGGALPSSFTYVPLSDYEPKKGEKLAIGSYAAQYLVSEEIRKDLYPTIVFDALTDHFTFNTNTADILSISGTVAAQQGSSGGGIAASNGELVGLITTSSIKGDVTQHTLNAITPLHIRASFEKDTGVDFDAYLTANSPQQLIDNFADEAEVLRSFLIRNLSR